MSHGAGHLRAIELPEGIFVESCGRQIEYDTAARQTDDPVGIRAREMYLVQTANDRYALGAGDAMQQIEHARARVWVEACYRLVGENECWTLRQRTGDRNALLLSA